MKHLPQIILASKSPRRKMLLEQAGFSVTLLPIECDEIFPMEMPSDQVALYLAQRKARAALTQWRKEGVLLTADTVVEINGEILEKPTDHRAAQTMLRKLSGEKHVVYTGVTMHFGDEMVGFSERSEVQFAVLTEAEIEYYLEQFQPYDKAGSYGIQDWIGWVKVTGIAGSYANIIGLPIHRVYQWVIGQMSVTA